jgi:branched-chain amino acid transport system permease protein
MSVAIAYRRHLGWGVTLAALAFGLVYVIFLADRAATSDPTTFFSTLLDAITLGGLYFVVASGFTLVFGLMRVVNMAHGSLYLVAAYVAINVQRRIITGDPDIAVSSTQVSVINWFVVLLVAAVVAGLLGLAMQQLLLRWNQGQELRQALITIAISVIVADQVVVHTGGGTAQDMSFPGSVNKFVNTHVPLGGRDFSYSGARLFILGLAIVIGISLWVWLKKTRTGMVIRAGVDDRAMVAALGVNIQRTFMIAFFVGSALAGMGAVIGTSQTAVANGTDSTWLLNSLVVVIIGGMGSLGGAAIGSLLFGLIGTFSAAYLPSGNTQYAVIFTFILLAIVLAVRPYGIFGRPA